MCLPRHEEVDLAGPDLQVAQAVGRRAHLAGEAAPVIARAGDIILGLPHGNPGDDPQDERR
ncbi:hypothetical protein [Streptomyces asiaticus]